MGNEHKFKIPEECRGFGESGFGERRRVARSFVTQFVRKLAPPKSVDESDEAWTRAVRRRFIEICPLDCYAQPSDPLTRKGEYLADYTWAEEAGGGRVLLACESEWGTGRYGRTHWPPVEHDFEKLLAIKAPFKVLIFSSCREPTESRPETDFSHEYAREKLKASLEGYQHHLQGEVYIFIDLPQTRRPGDGKFQSFIWLAEGSGKANVEFMDTGAGRLRRPTEFEVNWN
jgi:hypothetical protein